MNVGVLIDRFGDIFLVLVVVLKDHTNCSFGVILFLWKIMIDISKILLGTLFPIFIIYVLILFFKKWFSGLLKGGLGGIEPAVPEGVYFRKEFILTPAEKKFYDVLVEAVGHEVAVFGQCRVADLIHVDSKKHFGAFNKIKSKHVDFVLMEKSDGALLCAIELDDKSHRRKDRFKRDEFLDDIFKQVGLPLFRFKVKSGYTKQDILKGMGISS